MLSPSPDRPRVLVVEDYEELAYVTGLVLEHAGIDAVITKTAAQAIDAARDIVARGERLDCALIDLYLPDNDGDYAHIAPLRAVLGPRPRFAAYTVRVTAEDRRRSAESGMDAHFSKPADVEAITTWIREAARLP